MPIETVKYGQTVSGCLAEA